MKIDVISLIFNYRESNSKSIANKNKIKASAQKNWWVCHLIMFLTE